MGPARVIEQVLVRGAAHVVVVLDTSQQPG
jgi:hypothetical protein